MSQYNSVHQHHDQTTTHTCFFNQVCKAGPLSCFLLFLTVPAVTANQPSSLNGYLQIWHRQPANDWKTFSTTWCQNLRHQLPSALGAALHVMYVSNIVLGKDLSIIWGCYSPQPVYSESHSNQSQLVGTTQTHKLADLNIVWVCWGHKCCGYENVLFRKSINLKMCRVLAVCPLFNPIINLKLMEYLICVIL